jgi:hypothetical protein
MSREIVGVDCAVAEIADEQVAADVFKAGRGDHESPGRIQSALRRVSAEKISIDIVGIDEAVA